MKNDVYEIKKEGYENMAEKSVAICSIVRNAQSSLKKNIPLIEKLRSKFKESIVVIFENDSKDDTKDILRNWNKNSPGVSVRLQDFNQITIPNEDINGVNRFFSKERISKMANYRNYYLEILESLNFNIDYLIIIDLDIARFTLDGVAHSFGLANQWDIITANGYSYSPKLKRRYHDTYALTEIGKDTEIQTESIINNNQAKWSFLKRGIPLIPVYSAFGGLAIYRYNLIKNKRYAVQENNDQRVEVKCEHFTFHQSIHQDRNIRCFINPEMEVFYEKITISKIRKFMLKNLS